MPVIGHIQIGDVPDRHKPGTGEIGWDYLFRHIDALGYDGWIGCEYHPAGDTAAGLGWRGRYGADTGCRRLVRPSRRMLRILLRMRSRVRGRTSVPHPEEPAKRASRRTPAPTGY